MGLCKQRQELQVGPGYSRQRDQILQKSGGVRECFTCLILKLIKYGRSVR